jgi:hypothetical protein
MAYTHNDPIHNTDPSGKESLMSLSTALNVTAVFVSSYSATTSFMQGDYLWGTTSAAIGLITLGAASAGPAIFKTIAGSCGAWCTMFFRFPAAERAVIAEVKAMQGTGLYAKARAAMASGQEVEVVIGTRTIIIAPQMPASGMTFFADNVFVIGREALVSEAEFFKTLLHELYRLAFQRGIQAGAVGAATEPTAAAAAFAERAIALFVR